MCGRRLLARRDLVPMQAAGTVGDEGEQPGTLGSIRLCSVGVKAGESPTVGHTPTPRIDVWLSETRPARRPIVPQRCAPSYFPPAEPRCSRVQPCRDLWVTCLERGRGVSLCAPATGETVVSSPGP